MPEPVPPVPRIDVDEMKRKLEAGAAIVVDVRRPEAYAAGHILGARSIGFTALLAGTHELPRDGEIVLYCT